MVCSSYPPPDLAGQRSVKHNIYGATWLLIRGLIELLSYTIPFAGGCSHSELICYILFDRFCA
jgi:hypothetical protein